MPPRPHNVPSDRAKSPTERWLTPYPDVYHPGAHALLAPLRDPLLPSSDTGPDRDRYPPKSSATSPPLPAGRRDLCPRGPLSYPGFLSAASYRVPRPRTDPHYSTCPLGSAPLAGSCRPLFPPDAANAPVPPEPPRPFDALPFP